MTPARPLIATYRLQMQPGFGFAEAVEAVPYLAELGISHLYLSPTWQAAPGSLHGYDVTDHARFSQELGGLAGFLMLAKAAHEHGLGIVIDIVPNHVGIAKARHPWWRDVLRYGQASPFAGHFDIDWEGQPQMRAGVVLVPTLGRPFGEAMEAGEFSLDIEESDIVLRYYDASFPLAPATYFAALGLPAGDAVQAADPIRLGEVASLLDRLRDATVEQSEVMRVQLFEDLRADSCLASWATERLAVITGTPGDSSSFDRLDELMRSQHYRLASWRVSGEETNYRRFFDVNDLAAIRVEHEPVFADTHRLIQELVEQGVVDGIRVDHVDGLYDPARYLERLAAIAGDRPIWVEKILGEGEELPPWPIAGTTGYEFLATVGDLLVDRHGKPEMTSVYDEFTGVESDFADTAFRARERIADRAFAGEVAVLALQLHRLAQVHRRHRDNTLRSLKDAISGLIACFPVYRTYLENDAPRAGDPTLIEAAAQEALERNSDITPEAMSFLVRVLLRDTADETEHARWVHFRRRFQQVSGPVMAKGVEDTTFYRFHRLLALNEVGAHPEQFGITVEEAHHQLATRGARWPASLLGSSTHDTKRSEDARARLLVLASMPAEWSREVRRWQRMNRRRKRVYKGRPVPGPNTEYYLYQVLVGSWQGQPDGTYRDRICDHLRKAMREAKVHTSWSAVDEGYEEAVLEFVRAILDGRKSERFIARMTRFVESINGAAAVNSLAMLTIKCLAPGVPDFYQGSEFPLTTLTDPDNRRPVDFVAAANSLLSLANGGEREPASAATKLWLTRALLELRRKHQDLLADGTNYMPLAASGPRASHVFAFARGTGKRAVVCCSLRDALGLVDASGHISPGRLDGTAVRLPRGGTWVNVLDGSAVTGQTVDTDSLFARLPVAVLVRREKE